MKLFKLFQNTVVSLNLASSICVASFLLILPNWRDFIDKWHGCQNNLGDLIFVEKHSFKINILSKRIPWNFTQFDRMLRMQIFCTYDELMGVQKFRRSASQYKYNS